ncbi:putative ras small monomeric [Phialemonium atrogriseum]|uniref:Ras small monomeric n=1 Tax=Phialemonium atrogriseum TaxID=1093897 RepID=A0AAJ0FMV6_9PEZI|nr:putative ras small monomeric [Phialemonium atrogriseum]KAK1766530.1 putative ras small monomeric [Phialemonium atrogriseum]
MPTTPHTPSHSTSSSQQLQQQQHQQQQHQPPIPISITICGDGGCGKSSITLRLVRSQWTSEYDPTIEDSYSITRRIDGATYHLSLTDTAGQEEYRGMWASSNLGADAFLLVYDITSRDSLDALQHFGDLIDMEAETRLDNAARARRAGVPGSAGAKTVSPVKIVAGNKCDLQESRQVAASVGLEWARRHGCGFMETSARLEVNIEETFALIVRRVVEARRLAELGVLEPGAAAGDDRHGITKPLTPLPADGGKAAAGAAAAGGGEKGSGGHHRMRGPSIGGAKVGPAEFWKRLRCW